MFELGGGTVNESDSERMGPIGRVAELLRCATRRGWRP